MTAPNVGVCATGCPTCEDPWCSGNCPPPGFPAEAAYDGLPCPQNVTYRPLIDGLTIRYDNGAVFTSHGPADAGMGDAA